MTLGQVPNLRLKLLPQKRQLGSPLADLRFNPLLQLNPNFSLIS